LAVRLFFSRVEDGRGGYTPGSLLRFPSPLIKPDVLISSIRLSDRHHRTTHGGCDAHLRGAPKRTQTRRVGVEPVSLLSEPHFGSPAVLVEETHGGELHILNP
jgi:hypothetical protein